MSEARTLTIRWITLAGAVALTVWAFYHPADSTALQQGHALGFTVAVMIFAGAGASVYPITCPLRCEAGAWRSLSSWVDVIPLALAGWVFLSAWSTAGVFSTAVPDVGGDLRAATNEAWWWIAASGFFVLARRMVSGRQAALAIFGLLLAGGVLLGVHTLHQYFISLPQTMQEYMSDPDRMLAQIGVEAPAGSAARMIFENRLRDGGPTATFALANSLAGPLAMIVIVAGGFLIDLLGKRSSAAGSRSAASGLAILMLATIVGLLLTALVTTGSRSGLLSVVIVAAGSASMWYAAHRSAAGSENARSQSVEPHFHFSRFFGSRWILAALSIFGLLAIAVVLRYGNALSNREWISQAPATIQLRLQYWWSTLAMVYDHPWFGAGPGNFQLAYQKYRDVQAHELIAEPHNFFFETLASGGVVGGLLLIAWLSVGIMYWRVTGRVTAETQASENQSPGRDRHLGVFLGVAALVGVVVVWYTGIASGDLPDFDANLLALPLSIAVYCGWQAAIRSGVIAVSMSQCRGIAAAATATGLIHLCFSGGWTIPGVSIFLIWLAAIASAITTTAPELKTTTRKHAGGSLRKVVPSVIAGTVWSVLIVLAIVFSWLPVGQTQARLAEVSQLMNTNRVASAEQILRTIIASDPLDSDAAIWRATIENRVWMQAMLASPRATSPSATSRQRKIADEAIAVAIDRSGNDPSRLRAIGEQTLQRYQVGGDLSDLETANEIFSIARRLSPTHESITAQQAEILRELERRGAPASNITAQQLAQRAEMLARAGGVVTRQLSLQPILRAQIVGRAALETPARMNADAVLQPDP